MSHDVDAVRGSLARRLHNPTARTVCAPPTPTDSRSRKERNMRYTRKWLGIGVTLGALALATATQASADVKTVRISGTERFKPNEEVVNTFRFTPGHLTVKSGETVTWTHNESP